jgi:hypothetical protein
MLMIIFGAGASYDSSPIYPPGTHVPGASGMAHLNDYYRPPLAKDLFANRPLFNEALNDFPNCKTVVPRLRDPAVISGEISIEALLQEIEAQATTYDRGRLELRAIRCYLQQVIGKTTAEWLTTIGGVTNYLSLLREIERIHEGDDPVCLVTFNYDVLLEHALSELGLPIRQMEDYTRRLALFRVFKLHGSVDWAREVEIDVTSIVNMQHPPSVLKYLIEHGAETRASDRFVMCHPSSMGVSNGHPVLPAIAIPVEKKQTFECPQYMIEELTNVLPHVTKILVIGWRATEAHFLDLLKRNLKPGVYLCIVAGSRKEAEDVKVRIHRALLNNQPSSSPEPTGFTEFMRTRRAEQILAG